MDGSGGRGEGAESAGNVIQEIICLVFAWNKIRFEVYINTEQIMYEKTVAAAAFSGRCAKEKNEGRIQITAIHRIIGRVLCACISFSSRTLPVHGVMCILKYFVYEVPRKKLNSTHLMHAHTMNHLPSSSPFPPCHGKGSFVEMSKDETPTRHAQPNEINFLDFHKLLHI